MTKATTVKTASGAVSLLTPAKHREAGIVAWFVITLLAVAFPGKFLFYAAPMLSLGAMAFSKPLASPTRFLGLWACLGGLGSLSVIFDFIEGRQVSWWGIGFGLYTYSTVILAFSSSPAAGVSERLYARIVYICAYFIILQTFFAVTEFVITGNPDYVSGSLGLTDTVGGGHTISQVNLTFNILMMIVFSLPLVRRRLISIAITLGMIVCAIAQSGHQTIFFIGTALVLSPLGRGNARMLGLLALPIIVIGMIALAFYPKTGEYAIAWFDKTVLNDHSLKRQIVGDAVDYLMDPKNFVVGLGLGQFTSRAAQFAAGDSLTIPLPEFIAGASGYYQQSLRPLLFEHALMGEGSAISKPYFSILSILAELGPIVSLAIITGVVMEMRRNFLLSGVRDKITIGASYYCRFIIVFIALCSTIENYLELNSGHLDSGFALPGRKRTHVFVRYRLGFIPPTPAPWHTRRKPSERTPRSLKSPI